ncbi:MAG TPA: sigma 54-interacting transcriptional regulator [Vicinamibacterales bacterium]|nr:sigma 54-interacting transcriptional regulator [Vicinamibacterales bacterium]
MTPAPPAPRPARLILLVAPDTPERTEIAATLMQGGHVVSLQELAAVDPTAIPAATTQAVVVDLAGGPDALKFLRRYVGTTDRVPVVCIADRRQMDASGEALRLGAVDIVARPVRAGDVTAAIANAREFAETVGQPQLPTPAIELPADSVFGASPAIREVLATIRRIAPSRCSVLVVGERGTGREMVARAIHVQGRRRDRPFLKIECATPAPADLEQLLEARIEHGSTVYLQDVHELAPAVQQRLVHLIRHAPAQEVHAETDGPEVRYIGTVTPGSGTAASDTYRELIERLGVVSVELPPLRQRTEDIPLLAMHFLKEASRHHGVPPKTFARSALTLLSALPWRGNAGELRALAERLAILVPRGVILLEDVLANVRLDGAEAMGESRGTLRDARERFEREYVAAVLQQHRGRVGAAARTLGIERTNLYRKIKQLKIVWAADRTHLTKS